MGCTKSAKIISNAIYSVGVAIAVCLITISLLGSNEAVFSDAMLPLTWRELSFTWLVVGTIPMVLACIAVYKFNNVKDSKHKKRNFILIFLPGFICSVCALFVIDVLLMGCINTFMFQGKLF